MILEQIPELKALTTQQKITLARELWVDASGDVNEPLEPAIAELLEKRRQAYQTNPDQVFSWEEVKARARARKHG